MNYTKAVTLDVYNDRGQRVTIFAKQGDTARVLHVTMTASGVKITPESGVEAAFRVKKPDGHSVDYPVTIEEDGTIKVPLSAQAVACPGRCFADVYLTKDGVVLSNAVFDLFVEAAPVGDGYDSTNEYGVMLDATQKAKDAAEAANAGAGKVDASLEAAKEATQEATDAAEAANAAADRADLATTAANEAAEAANTAAEKADASSQAADDAEAARKEAEAARETAEEQRAQDTAQAIKDAQAAAEAANTAAGDANTAADAANEAANAANEARETIIKETSDNVLLSKSWAVGETGVREGENEDNSKYYAAQAKKEVEPVLTEWAEISDIDDPDFKVNFPIKCLYYKANNIEAIVDSNCILYFFHGYGHVVKTFIKGKKLYSIDLTEPIDGMEFSYGLHVVADYSTMAVTGSSEDITSVIPCVTGSRLMWHSSDAEGLAIYTAEDKNETVLWTSHTGESFEQKNLDRESWLRLHPDAIEWDPAWTVDVDIPVTEYERSL